MTRLSLLHCLPLFDRKDKGGEKGKTSNQFSFLVLRLVIQLAASLSGWTHNSAYDSVRRRPLHFHPFFESTPVRLRYTKRPLNHESKAFMSRSKMKKPAPNYRAPTQMVALRLRLPTLELIDKYAESTNRTRSGAMQHLLTHALVTGFDARTVLQNLPPKEKKKDPPIFTDYIFQGERPYDWPPCLLKFLGWSNPVEPNGDYHTVEQQQQWTSDMLRVYGLQGYRKYPGTTVAALHPLPATIEEARQSPEHWTYTDHLNPSEDLQQESTDE